MSMRSISRKNKELLAVALLLNVAAGGWYLFLFTEVKAKNERVSVLVNQIDAEATEENLQNSVKAIVGRTEAGREKLKSAFVARDGTVTFIELLERAGDAVGASVTLNAVEERDRADTPKIGELRLTLTAAGAWPAVIRFVGLLESLPYEASIEQAALAHREVADALWRADLALIVLREK